MIERLLDWLFPKRVKRRALVARCLRAAQSYDEMGELARDVKGITWGEYCKLMGTFRRNDAKQWKELI
jgi:hypothetical protein